MTKVTTPGLPPAALDYSMQGLEKSPPVLKAIPGPGPDVPLGTAARLAIDPRRGNCLQVTGNISFGGIAALFPDRFPGSRASYLDETAMTVLLWVRAPIPSTDDGSLTLQLTGNDDRPLDMGWRLHVERRRLRLVFPRAYPQFTVTLEKAWAASEDWRLVGFVLDGQQVQLVVDGLFVASVTLPDSPALSRGVSYPINNVPSNPRERDATLELQWQSSQPKAHALVGSLRYFASVLTPAQILALAAEHPAEMPVRPLSLGLESVHGDRRLNLDDPGSLVLRLENSGTSSLVLPGPDTGDDVLALILPPETLLPGAAPSVAPQDRGAWRLEVTEELGGRLTLGLRRTVTEALPPGGHAALTLNNLGLERRGGNRSASAMIRYRLHDGAGDPIVGFERIDLHLVERGAAVRQQAVDGAVQALAGRQAQQAQLDGRWDPAKALFAANTQAAVTALDSLEATLDKCDPPPGTADIDAEFQAPLAAVETAAPLPLVAAPEGGVVVDGATWNQLRIRVVNTSSRSLIDGGSGHPGSLTLRWAAYDSAASPWGLARAGDALKWYTFDAVGVTVPDAGWSASGTRLSRPAGHTPFLAAGESVTFVFDDFRSTAPPGRAALLLEYGNLKIESADARPTAPGAPRGDLLDGAVRLFVERLLSDETSARVALDGELVLVDSGHLALGDRGVLEATTAGDLDFAGGSNVLLEVGYQDHGRYYTASGHLDVRSKQGVNPDAALEVKAETAACRLEVDETITTGGLKIDGTVKVGSRGQTLGPVHLRGKDRSGDLVPPGTIIMWFGDPANPPPGWVLCDRAPDLRSRFVVGTTANVEAGYSRTQYHDGATGGEESVRLNSLTLPRHHHTITPGSHEHTHGATDNESRDDTYSTDGEAGNYYKSENFFGYGWAHSATVNARFGYSGGTKEGSYSTTEAHENRPPYYALCFLKKT